MYLLPSHLAVGYLSAYFIKRDVIKGNTLLSNTVLLTSLIPDIDGLFSETIAGHHSILHTPSIWIVILAVLWLVSKVYKNNFYKYLGICIFIGAFSHLLTDWYAARTVGIQWLYPFSHQSFHLFPLNKAMGETSISSMLGKEFLTFYMSNALLFWSEVLVNIVVVVLVFKQKLLKS